LKPPPFAYIRPASLNEALDVLASDDGALPLAGGQSLVPMLNMRLVRPTTIVDITRLPGLAGVATTPEGVTVGGRVTHHNLARFPQLGSVSAIAAAVSEIGFQAIRHRGTLGGSLAHADPAAELATVLLSLDATVVLMSTAGERRVAIDDFLVGYYSTERQPGELITAVDIPTPIGLTTGFAEFSRRPGDFGLALCAVAIWDAGGARHARAVIGGLDVRPRRLPILESFLTRADHDGAVGAATSEMLASVTAPTSDIHGSADFRLHLGAEIIRRALHQVEGPVAA
jgi:carbon-monoxide dehydrogenase medium subunit